MVELHDAHSSVLVVNLLCCEPTDRQTDIVNGLILEGASDVNFIWGYNTNIHIHFEVVPETYENVYAC